MNWGLDQGTEKLRGDTEINLQNLAKGIYFLNIVQGAKIENKKIVIQ